MSCRNFMFDLIILNIWFDDFDYANNTLSTEVEFNKAEFVIESNPEKPGEFKEGRTCEFCSNYSDLVLELLDHPLKLTVISNGCEPKGEAQIIWPRDLLGKLDRGSFTCYSNLEEADLVLEEKVVGKICVQYRLRAKCSASDSDSGGSRGDDGPKKDVDIQKELDKIVDPNELFFLIKDDSDIVCDTMNDKKKEERPTALDLSRFKNLHGKVVNDRNLVERIYAPDCCHSKKYPPCNKNTCPKLGGGEAAKKKKGEMEKESSTDWACKAKKHNADCPHSNKFSEETEVSCSFDSSIISPDTDSESSCTCGQNQGYPLTPPSLKQTVYTRPRFCPICKNDVSWLPKFAACTKCGHKPTPYSVEKPYDENITADQILQSWAIDSPKNDAGDQPAPKRLNRCACKNGKTCAYCRIRKICKDILRCRNKKCSEENTQGGKNKTTKDICNSSSEDDCRMHLAKVFSELKDLYNLKPVPNKPEFEYNERCEKGFLETKQKKRKYARNRDMENKEKKDDMEKNSIVQAKKKLCTKKLYNYKTVRKYPGINVGHKQCVSSGKIVPANMGWLWTSNTVAIRNGWRPGAIRKPIKKIMKYFLKDYPVDTLNVSKYGKHKLAKKESEELIQKPTLHISKKKGAYLITMRPIKDATLLKDCADPYVNMKPIQFRIVKSPVEAAKHEIKCCLKEKFDKCTCRKPVSECFCRPFLDKKRLEFELNKTCKQKGIPNLKNSLVLSDTSDSEMEFDFGVTPPAGVIKPQLKKRPDLTCRETQYNEKDWILTPTFPKPLNKYMKPFDATDGRTLPPSKPCPVICPPIPPKKIRRLPVCGIVGGYGGIGGNKGAGRQIGGCPTNTPKPLFCNLARRAKATGCCYASACMPC